MKKETGVWIDHMQAVIVMGLNPDETIEVIRVISSLATRIRYSEISAPGAAHEQQPISPAQSGDRNSGNILNRYYDRVILHLRDATSLVLTGPGDAKYELQKRLDVHGYSNRIVAIQTAGQMPDEQIATEIRQHFEEYHIAQKERSSNRQ